MCLPVGTLPDQWARMGGLSTAAAVATEGGG